MSPSSLSSPTNTWSYSKGFETFDPIAATSIRGSSHHPFQENWVKPSRLNLDSGNGHEEHQQQLERRPGSSLASILNSHDENPIAA
ncbi:hypothetical protein BGZ50_008863, partial [Haplosporangium sp. Z 11]